MQEVAIPYDPQTEMQGVRRPRWRLSKDRSAWGMPPTYDEWLQIQQQGKTEFSKEEAAESGQEKEN